MTSSDDTGLDDWLSLLLRRFDPSWMLPTSGLDIDRAGRGGLRRISADSPEQCLARLLAIYETERPKLLAFARSMLGANLDLAEDLLQEVMRKVCQKPPVMREADREASFLYRAIRNEAVTTGTRASRDRGHDADDVAVRIPDPSAAFEDPVVFNLVIARALAALSPRERALVELVDIRRMTVKDAAAQLGIAVGTAKAYRFAALRRLRDDPGLNDLHPAA